MFNQKNNENIAHLLIILKLFVLLYDILITTIFMIYGGTYMSSFGFNVMDFGAKADGVTDDTQAIQSAIDFCT